MYSDLPPLDDDLQQLQPSSSLSLIKFSLSETTNYLDFGYYISILAIALSNVWGYVTEERRAFKTGQSIPLTSPCKRTESPKDLRLVYTALETLHSNIWKWSLVFLLNPLCLFTHFPFCSRFQSSSLGAIAYKGCLCIFTISVITGLNMIAVCSPKNWFTTSKRLDY